MTGVDEFERTLRIRADNHYNSAKEHRYSIRGLIFYNLALEYEYTLQTYRDMKRLSKDVE